MISWRSFPWKCLLAMDRLIQADGSLWRRFFVLNLLSHLRFLQPSLALFFLPSPFSTLREEYNTGTQVLLTSHDPPVLNRIPQEHMLYRFYAVPGSGLKGYDTVEKSMSRGARLSTGRLTEA